MQSLRLAPRTIMTIAALLCGSFSGHLAHAIELPHAKPTFADLPYAMVGTKHLMLDLYLPSNAQPPYPCVINIHGGDWATGDRSPIHPVTQELLDNGFAIASVSYRLTSQSGQYGTDVPVTFPAQIHDLKGAVRWLRANAQRFGLDPTRFGSFGYSAGGHLSALLGASGNVAALEGTVGGNLEQSSRLQAAADYSGPTDLLNITLDATHPPGSVVDHDAPDSSASRFIGWHGNGRGLGDLRANLESTDDPYPALLALCALANPVNFISADDPAFLIGHGLHDSSVPLRQSTRLADALADIGHPSVLLVAAAAGHGMLGRETDEATIAFFRQLLRTPGDVNTDGRVDVLDLLAVIGAWGPCPASRSGCLSDVSPHRVGDGSVDVGDLLLVISNWG